MKRVIVSLGLLLLSSSSVYAQAPSAVPSDRLQWDQEAPNLEDAQGYVYSYILDSEPARVLSGHTCSSTSSPYVCSAPFPAVTPGPHEISLTASNDAGTSLPSTPLAFRYVVVPSSPTNLRIIR